MKKIRSPKITEMENPIREGDAIGPSFDVRILTLANKGIRKPLKFTESKGIPVYFVHSYLY